MSKHPFDTFIESFEKSDWHPDVNKGAGQKGWQHEKDYTRGVHAERGGGMSWAGEHSRRAKQTYSPGTKDMHQTKAKEIHSNKLAEQRSMPKPKLPG